MGQGEARRGPPVGRHVTAVGLILLLGLVFWQVKWDPGDGYLGREFNLVLADVSTVLLCLILMLGPIARWVPTLRRLVPWGRELGIGVFVTAGLHLLILLNGGWDVLAFVLEDPPFDSFDGPKRILSDGIWAGANWVGLLALGYALVLVATSNDWSQRLLGRGWKFVQRQTYTLFVLVFLHTAAWLVFARGSDFERWFWTFAILVVVAQFAGFVHTVRSPRGPSPQRAPAKTRRLDSGPASGGAAKWAAVTLLWGGLIVGTLAVAAAEDPAIPAFCDRYEELRDLDYREIREELAAYVAQSDGNQPIEEWIDECDDRQGR